MAWRVDFWDGQNSVQKEQGIFPEQGQGSKMKRNGVKIVTPKALHS